MAVTKQRKAEIFNDLVAKLKGAKSVGFAITNTLTVEEFAALRKGLREVNASYTLAKKTIIKKAVKEALGLDVELSDLPGQIGVLCSNEDAIAGFSKLNAFMKEANGPKGDLGKLAWAISIMDGEVKTQEETKVLASMPSRDTLLGRLVGSMKSPISALARFFDSAAKEVEKQGKSTVGELEKDAPAAPVEAPKAEETKVEEVKEEVVPEAPAVETPATEEVVEAKEETLAEAVATEEVTTNEEAPVEDTAEEKKAE